MGGALERVKNLILAKGVKIEGVLAIIGRGSSLVEILGQSCVYFQLSTL